MTTFEDIVRAREELVAEGLIEDSGERRPDKDGKMQIVWRLSALGEQVARLAKEEK